jgi:hypothetical protein
MLLHPHTHLEISEIDGLFPSQADTFTPGKAEDALQSHMITGFEEALSLGMSPMEALTHVLYWVASEMGRINAGQAAESLAASRPLKAG